MRRYLMAYGISDYFHKTFIDHYIQYAMYPHPPAHRFMVARVYTFYYAW